MGEKDTLIVMTAIDWGTALAAVNRFLLQEDLPSDLKDEQLAVLARFIVDARQRLRETRCRGPCTYPTHGGR